MPEASLRQGVEGFGRRVPSRFPQNEKPRYLRGLAYSAIVISITARHLRC